ncbi:telomere-protecting terminal protein Tpg [Kitasatospora sp. NBC_00039]|uniref:telomere-protecting terminal protein Tpg n=1 Tax=Kitasatospora sp. NBC_00039 TaxID=2903565 RepID=UPI00325352CA
MRPPRLLQPAAAARTRPPLYCSRSCRSKVDRAKAKQQPPSPLQPAAAPAGAAPAATGPAATATVAPGPTAAPTGPALAAELGVSQRTVQRWLKGEGTPKPAAAKAIEAKVRTAWQPRVKQRVRKAAETNGFMLHISGTFGYSAAGGSTDDPRPRTITQKMPGSVAQRLYAARDAGATQAQQEQILAEALRDEYFKDRGHRARSLDVELNDVAWMDLEGL